MVRSGLVALFLISFFAMAGCEEASRLAVVHLSCDGDQNGDGLLGRSEDGDPSSLGTFEMRCSVTFNSPGIVGREVRIVSSYPQTGTVVGSARAELPSLNLPVSLAVPPAPIRQVLSVVVPGIDLDPSSAGFTCAVVIDFSVPSVAIELPAPGALLAANDKDPSTEEVLDCCLGPDGPYDVTARVAGGAGRATLKVNGSAITQAAIGSDGVVRFPNAPLPQGALTLTVEAASESGNLGTSPPVAVEVDSVPPKVSLTSYTLGESIASNLVTFSVSYRDVEPRRILWIRDRSAVVASLLTADGDPASERSATVEVPMHQGPHQVQAEVSDSSGNVGRSAVMSFTVTTENPLVVFEVPPTSPALWNRESGTIDASNRLHLDLVVSTLAPAGGTVFLSRNGVDVASALLDTVGNISKAVFADQIFADGETGTLQARVRLDPQRASTPCPGDENNFCSLPVPYRVDLSAPTLAFQSPACKPYLNAQDRTGGAFVFTLTTSAENGQTVTVSSSATSSTASGVVFDGVATTSGLVLPEGRQTLTAWVTDLAGNMGAVTCETTVKTLLTVTITSPSAGTLNAANDKNPATPTVLECCIGPGGRFDVTAQTTGGPTQATLKANGLVLAQANVLEDIVTFVDAPLPQGALSLTVEAIDVAGNLAVSAPVLVTVDTLPPVVGPLTASHPPHPRGRVTLGWTMPGDNGVSGTVASYEIRRCSTPIGTACPVDVATPQAFERLPLVARLPDIQAGGTIMSFHADDTPLDADHVFALRATDAAGNTSNIGVSPVVSNPLDQMVVPGTSGEPYYAWSIAVGKFAQDSSGNAVYGLAVGRPGAYDFAGAVSFLYSSPEVPAGEFTGASDNLLLGYVVANAGDLNGDGFDDLLVSAPLSGGGRVYLLFGSATGIQPATAIAIELPDSSLEASYFGQSLAGLGLIPTGDGSRRPHFAIGAADFMELFNPLSGRVYVYYYDAAEADPAQRAKLRATLVGTNPADRFGESVCGVGDVNGDGIPDLLVGGSGQVADSEGNIIPNHGVAFLFLGVASLAGTIDLGTCPECAIQIPNPSTLYFDWFGQSCARVGDLDGDGVDDFVVNAPGSGAMVAYAFRGRQDLGSPGAPPLGPTAVLRVPEPPGVDGGLPLYGGYPGQIAGGEDIDGDGRPDIVIGDKGAVHLFCGDSRTLVRSGESAVPFGASPCATFLLPLYPDNARPVALVKSWVITPDGGALPDLVIADPAVPDGGSDNRILIRY
jgi:hypothetical protein